MKKCTIIVALLAAVWQCSADVKSSTRWNHTLILKPDGTVLAYGDNSSGQLGDGTQIDKSNAVPVVNASGVIMSNISDVAAGQTHSLAISNGYVYGWGSQANGRLGNGVTSSAVQKNPVRTLNISNIIAVAAGGGHSLALEANGHLWAWGYNNVGQVGNYTYTQTNKPVLVLNYNDDSPLESVFSIAAGADHSVALAHDDWNPTSVYGWGSSPGNGTGKGWLPNYNEAHDITGFLDFADFTDVSAGTSYTLALGNDGSVWGWGINDQGQLGDGTTIGAEPDWDPNHEERWHTAHATNVTGIVRIAAGYKHSLAVRNDGFLHSWGYNNYGQLGDYTRTRKLGATNVYGTGLTATNIALASAGYDHSVAISTDLEVLGWGHHANGQIGNGEFDFVAHPHVPVGCDSGIAAVASGYNHTLLLKTDGTVLATGHNAEGELGDGTQIDRTNFVPVQNLSGVSAIAAGSTHSLAISNGFVYAWGYNTSRQLGISNTTFKPFPVLVSNLVNITAIAVGENHNFALDSSGTVWAWGANGNGQCGLGHNGPIYMPQRVPTNFVPTNSFLINVDFTATNTAPSTKTGCAVTCQTSSDFWNTCTNGTNVTVANLLKADGSSTTAKLILASGNAVGTVGSSDAMLNDYIYRWTNSGNIIITITNLPAGTYNLYVYSHDGHYQLSVAGLDYGTKLNRDVPITDPATWQEGKQVSVFRNLPVVATKNLVLTVKPGIANYAVIAGLQIEQVAAVPLTTVTSIAAGATHGAVVLSNGEIYAWGDAPGCGWSSTVMAYTNFLTHVVTETHLPIQLEAGYDYTEYLRGDGTVWGWGGNGYSQLGTGNTTGVILVNTNGIFGSPVWVTNLYNVEKISGGQYHTIAVQSNHQAVAWGLNSWGQLGIGYLSTRAATNTQVVMLPDAAVVSAGVDHSAAVTTGGSALTWGNAQYGQLGDRNTGFKVVPTPAVEYAGPPGIIAGPESQILDTYYPAVFTVQAVGPGSPFTYQWKKDGNNISGATTTSLTVSTVTQLDAGSYTIVVSSSYGSASSTAYLVVRDVPLIVTQPANETKNAGQNVTFSVSAVGSGPFTYQWYYYGEAISYGTNSSVTISNLTTDQAGYYSVAIVNQYGETDSDDAELIVVTPPEIWYDPYDQTAYAGDNVTNSVVADGLFLSYQWRKNGSNIPGATSENLPLPSITSSDEGSYNVVVSNSAGSVTSATAIITVLVPPAITTQPVSQTKNVGENATFSVTATGTAPLTYQWAKDGNDISGATQSSLTLTSVTTSDEGAYSVVVSNPVDATQSSVATLTVTSP